MIKMYCFCVIVIINVWAVANYFLLNVWIITFCLLIGRNLGILTDHKGFVQGVAWDPCKQYVATISSDRQVINYLFDYLKNYMTSILVVQLLVVSLGWRLLVFPWFSILILVEQAWKLLYRTKQLAIEQQKLIVSKCKLPYKIFYRGKNN